MESQRQRLIKPDPRDGAIVDVLAIQDRDVALIDVVIVDEGENPDIVLGLASGDQDRLAGLLVRIDLPDGPISAIQPDDPDVVWAAELCGGEGDAVGPSEHRRMHLWKVDG